MVREKIAAYSESKTKQINLPRRKMRRSFSSSSSSSSYYYLTAIWLTPGGSSTVHMLKWL
jgi:hypothetical protein